MRLKVEKSVYPLFVFVGSSLTMATGFTFHNLFNRPEVHLWKMDRMTEYPRKLE